MSQDFLEIAAFSAEQLQMLLGESRRLKELYAAGEREPALAGKVMAMIFEKPSSRTRISFETGMAQLGGSTIYLTQADIGGLGQREPIKDLARVLEGMVDLIVARTFAHGSVIDLAQYADIPVINALTDKAHPCQAMADVLTIQESFGELGGRKIAFVGDGNNVAWSLAMACRKLGMAFVLAAPEGYRLADEAVAALEKAGGPGSFATVGEPYEAVRDADVIYTDTWTSMGQEAEKERRIRDFAGYQVNAELVRAAKPEAIVMHCLPAYRGLEITDEVIESAQSVVFAQAANRLHFQRALMKVLLTEGL